MVPEPDREHLETLMAAMAAGDASTVFPFHEAFGPEVERVVRRQVRAFGRFDVLGDADEVHGLVIDAVFAIFERAGGWRADGAPPWVWAGLAIRAVVARGLGHPSTELDDDHLDDGPIGATADVDFALLARDHDEVALLVEALRRVTSERDCLVVEQYLTQQADGDPSPAHTVGAALGLQPDNVRQIAARAKRKVRRLIGDHERYQPLASMRWLAA